MGCAASTLIASVEEDTNQMKEQITVGDINTLTRTAVDSGDLLIKDTKVYGDQVNDNQEVSTEDTNFHNSPSNVIDNNTTVSMNVEENPETTGNISASTTLGHNEACDQHKLSDVSNNQGEKELVTDNNHMMYENSSISINQQGHIPRSALNMTMEERTRLLADLSPEFSKQQNSSLKPELEQIQENDFNKYSPLKNVTNDAEAENILKIVNTFAQSSASSHLDLQSTNFEINHTNGFESNYENARTSSENVNHNHLPAKITSLDHLMCSNEPGNVKNWDTKYLPTGDTCLGKLEPLRLKNPSLEIDENQNSSDVSMVPKKSSLPRTSNSFYISRQSYNSQSFKQGILNYADISDNFDKDIQENQYKE